MLVRSVLACVVAAALAFAGCNSVVAPGGDNSGGNPGSTASNGSLAVGDPSDAARTALEVVGWAIAAIQPVKDLQGFVEGTLPLPSCPSLEANIAANALAVSFDYGAGCAPRLFSVTTLQGKAAGTSFVTLNAFDLDFTDLTIDGVGLGGNTAGGYSRVDGVTTLAMTVNLVADNGLTVSGSVTIELNDATGDYLFVDAELTFTTAELGTWTVTYEGATVRAGDTGSYRALTGTAVVESVTGSTSAAPTIVEVTLAQ